VLLQRLKEYADAGRVENMAPVSYKETPIRYVVDLDESGRFLGCTDQATGAKGREKRGKLTIAPHVGRAYAIRPKLLADNAEYALGIARNPAKQERVDQSHQAFTDLVRACATETGEKTVAAALAFLESGADTEGRLQSDFDPGAVVTFRVGDVLPIDLASVRGFWAKRAGGEEGDEGDTAPKATAKTMQCLVCSEVRPAVERLVYKWQGITGGQTSGLALISANAPAFESYGLEASLIAPTCAECGERFSKAANALLSDNRTCLRVRPLTYIFWTREPVPDFSFGGFFTDPKPEEVRGLLESARRGQREAVEIDDTPFYAAAFSASGARVVVRDWVDTTVGTAKDHLRRYFALQEIVGPDGAAAPPLKLVALAGATVRDLKDLTPGVIRALLRIALAGGRVPPGLLYEAVRRCRAEGRVTRSQAALIKMVLLGDRITDQERGENVVDSELVKLDLNNREPAYLCGRLLAVLEATQRAALGDINATIVDRYYGTASSAPASVFGRLLKGVQPHLGKLRRDPHRRGAYHALEGRLMDIMNEETGIRAFPLVLDLPSQGLFSLGYYHQRAADRAAARGHRELTALVTNPANEVEGSGEGQG